MARVNRADTRSRGGHNMEPLADVIDIERVMTGQITVPEEANVRFYEDLIARGLPPEVERFLASPKFEAAMARAEHAARIAERGGIPVDRVQRKHELKLIQGDAR